MSLEKLRKASEILAIALANLYNVIEFRENRYELFILLKTGVKIYIRYNTFGEYGYRIVFSNIKHDRVRYDNFDDHWDVSTKPHHKHLRGTIKAIESPMTGVPSHDIPIFSEEIRKYQN